MLFSTSQNFLYMLNTKEDKMFAAIEEIFQEHDFPWINLICVLTDNTNSMIVAYEVYIYKPKSGRFSPIF